MRPASTLPGPTSTYVVTPSAPRRCTTSCQRTGDDTCRTSAPIAPAASCFGSASTLATTGTRGACAGSGAKLGLEPILRRLHQRAVKWRAHGQRHGLACAQLFGPRGGAGDGRGVSGNDHLPRRVEVGRADDLPVGRVAAGLFHERRVRSEDRGHRAGADRHGFLHVAAAPAHERDAIGEREGPGSHVRRVLAEAVPGDEAGLEPARRQDAVGGQADRQNRRLRVLGERELVLGPVFEHGPERHAGTTVDSRGGERGLGLGQRRFRFGKRRRERLSHADLLRALPGKHEGDACAHETPANATPRVTCDTTSLDARRAAMAIALRTALADEWPCATIAVPATPSSGAPPYSE